MKTTKQILADAQSRRGDLIRRIRDLQSLMQIAEALGYRAITIAQQEAGSVYLAGNLARDAAGYAMQARNAAEFINEAYGLEA